MPEVLFRIKNMERTILHSDLNAFFASVECMLNPSLQGKPMAVCGSTEKRHGIVLAKSEQAKKYGVTTGEATWQAVKKCPDLVIVPPHHDQYIKYSRLAREIYSRFTDKIEPFGIDEAWLDMTGSGLMFADGYSAAEEIRKTISRELGLTVSVGVSFNKVFAKLCSDLKKPDAVTVVKQSEFKHRIWPLPARDMIFVGKESAKKLEKHGIRTIGDIAATPVSYLEHLLGKSGVVMWRNANGLDVSGVAESGFDAPMKSISHGTTTERDLRDNAEVKKVILYLSREVARRLREGGFYARKIQIAVRGNDLIFREFQTSLPFMTRAASELADAAAELFAKKYTWNVPVRAVTVRAISLVSEQTPEQLDLFCDYEKHGKAERIDSAADEICRRYGEGSIVPASILKGIC